MSNLFDLIEDTLKFKEIFTIDCNEHQIKNTTVQSYPIIAMEIVINDSEAFPGVIAPVSPAHQVLYNQADVNQSDLIVWRQMTLQEGTDAKWWVTLDRLWFTH